MTFNGKVALITGGAGAIGKATAKLYVERGGKVALVDYDKAALDRAPGELNLKTGDYLLIQADVSREEDVIRYFNETVKKFGRIDLFFNNAGVEGEVAYFADYSTEALNKVCDINIKGAFWGIKYALKTMIKLGNGGAIVNSSSCAGLKGMLRTPAYVMSKHAIIGMTRAAALEYSKEGIRINAVCPAVIDGPMMTRIRSGQLKIQGKEATEANINEMRKNSGSSLPIGRCGTPEDIAQGVLYLASDEASFITGIAFPIDGGITI